MSLNIRHDVPLAQCGTFQLGGPCQTLYDCKTEAEVLQAVRELRETNTPWLLIGGGSNILFSDHGFTGTLIRYWRDDSDINFAGPETDRLIEVSGSTPLDALAKWTCEAGLAGLECTTGIPGAVGGAVAGNAGAWGQQIGDRVVTVRVVDPAGTVTQLTRDELDFAYRDSMLKRSDLILLSAQLQLDTGDRSDLLAERERILALRAEKHPNLETHPCIGSIFRNIEPTSAAGRRQAAGWFLEESGAKGCYVGGAELFSKHANIIVKGQGCTAQDVHDLCAKLQALVHEKQELELRREVRFLGSFVGSDVTDRFF